MARARFDLLDRAGKPVPLNNSTWLKEFSFSPDGTGYGFPDLVRREFLEKSEHLFNDCFTISCGIIISDELRTEDRIAASPLVSLAVPPSDLDQHLNNLLVGKEGADVTFQVAGEAFSAHRFLLAARSRVFKAELCGAMKERALPQGVASSRLMICYLRCSRPCSISSTPTRCRRWRNKRRPSWLSTCWKRRTGMTCRGSN